MIPDFPLLPGEILRDDGWVKTTIRLRTCTRCGHLECPCCTGWCDDVACIFPEDHEGEWKDHPDRSPCDDRCAYDPATAHVQDELHAFRKRIGPYVNGHNVTESTDHENFLIFIVQERGAPYPTKTIDRTTSTP